MSSSFGLSERVAIVTGGASGIGRAVVRRFSEAGAGGVVVADTNRQAAEDLAVEVSSGSATACLAVETDVSDERQVRRMVDAAVARFGRVDILVNNAGICPVVAWDDADPQSWRRILDVNLTGMYLCTRAVVPLMRSRSFGRIVFVSSTAAMVGSLVAHVAYGASKAGVLALMKSVAKGFARDGILANAICPGSIDTPLTDSLGADAKERFAADCLLKRQGTPKEVADAALFLVSDQSTFITGVTIPVNGGLMTV